jgi:hypothetical protein
MSRLICAPCVWPGVRRAGLPRQSPPLTPGQQAIADVLSRQAATQLGRVTGKPSGTTAAGRVMNARLGPVKMSPDLDF